MKNEFTFLLASGRDIEKVLAIRHIATESLANLKEGEEIPPKFLAAIRCADNILGLQSVSQPDFQGFADVAGGFYVAAEMYNRKKYAVTKDDKESLEKARELVVFVLALLDKVKGEWKLEVLK